MLADRSLAELRSKDNRAALDHGPKFRPHRYILRSNALILRPARRCHRQQTAPSCQVHALRDSLFPTESSHRGHGPYHSGIASVTRNPAGSIVPIFRLHSPIASIVRVWASRTVSSEDNIFTQPRNRAWFFVAGAELLRCSVPYKKIAGCSCHVSCSRAGTAHNFESTIIRPHALLIQVIPSLIVRGSSSSANHLSNFVGLLANFFCTAISTRLHTV